MAPTRKSSGGGRNKQSKRGSGATASKKAGARHASSSKHSKTGAAASHTTKATKAGKPQLYGPTDLILVLGDGDFTFSRGLVKHRGTGDGVLATSFDSDETVRTKYANAAQCINDIRSLGARVLHDVDATRLDELPTQLKRGNSNSGPAFVPTFFHFIVFNFPHSGAQRVHVNRVLLRDFFTSARSRLFQHGEVHVTLKTSPPYSNWLIEEQAASADFVLKERRKFDITHFSGYNHRTTDPTAKAFEPDQCITYIFVVNRTKHPFHVIAQAATDAAHRRKLDDAAARSGTASPTTAVKDTAIAQLLAAHARAKAANVNAPAASDSSVGLTPVAVAPHMATPVKVRAASSSSNAPVAAVSTHAQQTAAYASQCWTPLHRRPLVLHPPAATHHAQQSSL